MPSEHPHRTLDELTEETARQIIWTLQPGATSDPLTAVKHLLFTYLDQAQEQQYQDALREHWQEEHDQQN